MNFIKPLWQKIPLGWKQELVSVFHTFIGAMIAELLLQLASNGGVIPTGKQALLALLTAGVRSGWKALVMTEAKKVEASPQQPVSQP